MNYFKIDEDSTYRIRTFANKIHELRKAFVFHFECEPTEENFLFLAPRHCIQILVSYYHNNGIMIPGVDHRIKVENGETIYAGLRMYYNFEESVVLMDKDALLAPPGKRRIMKMTGLFTENYKIEAV